MTRAMSRVINMDPNAGIQKLRAASCSVLLLLLTLALVASSLLVARYAVQASSWWLSLLAVTVCLLGLCTWIQLAASRAGRWRAVLARQIALSRAQAAQAQARALRGGPGLGPGLGLSHDLYSCGAGAGRCGTAGAPISTIPVECSLSLDCQAPYRVAGPPPPPPYALPDLPPSYSVSVAAADVPADAPVTAPPLVPVPLPPPGPEPPPPYAVAIKRDHLVQGATTGALPFTPAPEEPEGPEEQADECHRHRAGRAAAAPAATDRNNNGNSSTVLSFNINGGSNSSVLIHGTVSSNASAGAPSVGARERVQDRDSTRRSSNCSNPVSRRPILWY